MNDNYSKRRIEDSEWVRRRIDTGERAHEGTYRPVQRRKLNKKKFARTVILFICLIIAGVAGSYIFSEKILPVFVQDDDAAPVQIEVQPEGNVLAGKLIVLDAGHGGFDIGATGVSGVFEDDLNLKVVQYLKADLEKKGAQVVLTREDENAIAETKDEDMAKRRQIIQQSGSDIVVSIHMNSETESSFSGPIVLFMPGSSGGERLAQTIQQSLLAELKPETQTVARAEDLFITESGTQPCVLVECGFISNPKEEALLVTSEYQQKVAQAVVDGCSDYFSQD